MIADLKKHHSGDLTRTNPVVVEAIETLAGTDHSGYQTKTDETLTTTSKTVVGAIGEVKNTADGAAAAAAAAFPAANISVNDDGDVMTITIGEKSYTITCAPAE